jgi:hypothetical protein
VGLRLRLSLRRLVGRNPQIRLLQGPRGRRGVGNATWCGHRDVASAEDWHPILNSLNDEFARGNHVLKQEAKKGRLAGFGRVLFRGTSLAEVLEETSIRLLVK